MKLTIKKGVMNGEVDAVSSKSYAHRYIISSMLSESDSVLYNVYKSEDILATLGAIKFFNKSYKEDNGMHIFNKECNEDVVIDCNESGSTLRFLIPIALVKFGHAKFIGKETLFNRGLDVYLKIFEDNNISYVLTDDSLEFEGTLKDDTFYIPGNISSQYITGLLFSLPLLNFDTKIVLTTELESKNYIDITLEVLKNSGINIDVIDNTYIIKGNQHYNLTSATIEGDYSNASFFEAFNYLGSNIKINGLNPDSLQGDKVFKKYFHDLNEKFCTIDISNCIDLGPVLFTFASMKKGGRFTGTKRLRIKESDRVDSITDELKKCGASINVYDDEVIIKKSKLHNPFISLNGHNDHRVVMSLSLLSSLFTITIDQAEAVSKSYPTYFKELARLGLDVEDEDVTK